MTKIYDNKKLSINYLAIQVPMSNGNKIWLRIIIFGALLKLTLFENNIKYNIIQYHWLIQLLMWYYKDYIWFEETSTHIKPTSKLNRLGWAIDGNFFIISICNPLYSTQAKRLFYGTNVFWPWHEYSDKAHGGLKINTSS